MPDSLQYVTGEEICKGDRVRFHGHDAQIEFAAADLGDPEHSCFVRLYGGGVMVNRSINSRTTKTSSLLLAVELETSPHECFPCFYSLC